MIVFSRLLVSEARSSLPSDSAVPVASGIGGGVFDAFLLLLECIHIAAPTSAKAKTALIQNGVLSERLIAKTTVMDDCISQVSVDELL